MEENQAHELNCLSTFFDWINAIQWVGSTRNSHAMTILLLLGIKKSKQRKVDEQIVQFISDTSFKFETLLRSTAYLRADVES